MNIVIRETGYGGHQIAQDWAKRVRGQKPSKKLFQDVSNYFNQLELFGINEQNIDCILLTSGMETEAQALTPFVFKTPSVNNGATWSTGGFSGGGTGYIDTKFVPNSSMTKGTINNSFIGLYLRTNVSENAFDAGASSGLS